MITPISRPEAAASRRLLRLVRTLVAGAGVALASVAALADDGPLGRFAGHTDIGTPKQAGTVAHDAVSGDYVIGGGGANMWFKSDSFHFVWEKAAGDVALAADISFPQSGGNNHRKGILMIRQSLDADSSYADVALHGDGLTSLQFREVGGDVTHEVQTTGRAPKRLRLEKVGDYVYLSVAGDDGDLRPTGCSVRLAFKAPFYVGLGVCAHDDNAFETVRFSRVAIGEPPPAVATARSSLEYVKVPSGDRVCVYRSSEAITAAAWAGDGSLHFVQGARNFRIPALGGSAEPAGTAGAPAAAASVSPDGKWSARIEHQNGNAVLTLQPATGGEARVLMRVPDQSDAPLMISWSFDSTKIAYVRAQPGRSTR